MPIQIWGKNGVLAYFGPKMGHFGHIFWDKDFKFDHFSLQQTQKWPCIISKSHFAQVAISKKPTPPTFFHENSETFRIDVNVDQVAESTDSAILDRPTCPIKLSNMALGQENFPTRNLKKTIKCHFKSFIDLFSYHEYSNNVCSVYYLKVKMHYLYAITMVYIMILLI